MVGRGHKDKDNQAAFTWWLVKWRKQTGWCDRWVCGSIPFSISLWSENATLSFEWKLWAEENPDWNPFLSQQSSPRISKDFPHHFSPASSPSCYAGRVPYSPRDWPLWLDILPLFIKLGPIPHIWFLTKTLFQGVDMERKRGIIFKCINLSILSILY